MYPSDITHHFTTGTLILQVSATFYKSYQRITTVNMKNSKAKDGSRSSQIPSFQIYLTYPAFSHQNIFFNYILQMYSMRERFRNICLKRQSDHQVPEPQESAVVPRKLFRTCLPHWRESKLSMFCFFLG